MKHNTTTDYRDVFFFEWPGSDESSFIQTSRIDSHGREEGICFIPCDLAAVSMVRDFIERKCVARKLKEEQAFEISLIADELVSNGIAATYEKDGSESIMLRYRISDDHVIISVLDYGGGFSLPEVQNRVPDGESLEDFMESLRVYRGSTKLKIPFQGKLTEHQKFGRGLQIVTGISDAVVIMLHTKDGKLTRNHAEDTLGAVVSVRYDIPKKSAA
ncbi:MAG: ATP-binding protein [Leptospiraceae bacterium]|nr:ATP-binding protein [Leptospiraceae bacterium]